MYGHILILDWTCTRNFNCCSLTAIAWRRIALSKKEESAHPLYCRLSRQGLVDEIKLAYKTCCRKASC